MFNPKGGEGSGGASYGPKNLKIDFACAQCWQAGLKSLPDKGLKYCSGSARHTWVTVLSFSYSLCLNYVLCNPASSTSGGLKTGRCCWSPHQRERNGFRSDLCRMPSTSLTIMKYVCLTVFHILGVNSPQLHSLQMPFSSLVASRCRVLLTLIVLLADVHTGFEEKEM